MIIYDLICDSEHEFEGWFKNADDMLSQKEQGLLSCPYCDSPDVNKQLTAAKLTKKSNSTVVSKQEVALGDSQSPQQYAQVQKMLVKLHDYVDGNFIDVGNRFAEEAIGIHRGEKDPANIRGTVNEKQFELLVEEGVDAVPLPARPKNKNRLN